MFLKNEDFPQLQILVDFWKEIRSEITLLEEGDYIEWPHKSNCIEGWKIFPLRIFSLEVPFNVCYTPLTSCLLREIPGVDSASFSKLSPRTYIAPHIGFTDEIWRVHLPLIVPGRCAIRVGGELREWVEGELLIFDDMTEHDAWNHSDTDRIILMVDIKKDPLGPGLKVTEIDKSLFKYMNEHLGVNYAQEENNG